MLLEKDQWPGLPKWPMAFITGKDVTPEQAKEIIFRTDRAIAYPSAYGMGNDDRFRARVQNLFGWTEMVELQETFHKMGESEREAFRAKYNVDSPWDLSSRWSEGMGMISTQYVTNDWFSTAYIGGPHGWCSPEGKIHSDGHNYGKWPSVEEIVNDWKNLVAAFPYLDLVCTMYSGEQCEEHSEPVCSIVVKDGKVEVHAPDLSLHTCAPSMGENDVMDRFMSILSGDYSSERGWPEPWIQEFAERSKSVVKTLIA